jgi:ribosomal protein L34E
MIRRVYRSADMRAAYCLDCAATLRGIVTDLVEYKLRWPNVATCATCAATIEGN